MTYKKKGVVEIQFNWIFILIVGGVILLFFITLVIQQSKVSNKRLYSALSLDMSSIFSGSQISTNTEHLISIPPVDIQFECDNISGYSAYTIKSSVSSLGESFVLFSPDLITGQEMVTWSLDWNVPFRVMNFLYLTSPQVRYIIYNTSKENHEESLYDSLPDLVYKGAGVENNLDFLQDSNNYKVRIVTLGPIPLIPEAFKDMDDDLSLVEIIPSEGMLPDGNGIVNFYRSESSAFVRKGSVLYVGRASLYGAVFSETPEAYNCNMQKAFRRLSILSLVYENRTKELSAYYRKPTVPDPQNCGQLVLAAQPYLESMSLLDHFTSQNADTLVLSQDSIMVENRRIQRYSCPVIY